MTTRAKFKLDKIERIVASRPKIGDDGKAVTRSGYAVYEPCEMRTIVMSPVYAHGDPNHENSRFWAASPSGQLILSVCNLPAVEHMELGAEFYVDIIPAKTPQE